LSGGGPAVGGGGVAAVVVASRAAAAVDTVVFAVAVVVVVVAAAAAAAAAAARKLASGCVQQGRQTCETNCDHVDVCAWTCGQHHGHCGVACVCYVKNWDALVEWAN